MGTGLPLLSYCGRIIGAKSRGDFAGTDACADRCTQTARRARFPGRFVSTLCERSGRAERELRCVARSSRWRDEARCWAELPGGLQPEGARHSRRRELLLGGEEANPG